MMPSVCIALMAKTGIIVSDGNSMFHPHAPVHRRRAAALSRPATVGGSVSRRSEWCSGSA
jgi:hypothetical protein